VSKPGAEEAAGSGEVLFDGAAEAVEGNEDVEDPVGMVGQSIARQAPRGQRTVEPDLPWARGSAPV